MSFLEEYKQKLVSADEAVKIVKSGDWVDYGWCTGTPDALDKALARRTEDLCIRVLKSMADLPIHGITETLELSSKTM